jgi:hypothetical protein
MRAKITLFILFISIAATAQTPIDTTLNGQTLLTKLRTDYTPNQTLGYNNGRDEMYSIVDNDGANGVHCIYTDFTIYWTPGTDPSSNIYQGGAGINAEHVYPQSLGAGSEPARSDMHNLRPCRAPVNSDRGNCPFGDITDNNTDKWHKDNVTQTSMPTATDIDNWSEKENDNGCVFEPRESVKGNIARIVFYFYTIYPSADANFFNGMKNTLIQWHYADPVDAQELERSTRVKSFQGKHNPYVLDSTLARRAFFPQWVISNTEKVSFNQLNISIFPNPAQSEIRFSEMVESVQIFDLNGRLLLEQQENNSSINELNISTLTKGNYILIYAKDGQKGRELLLKD